jgi:RimJ/RimL family protein N-acetyltransferase
VMERLGMTRDPKTFNHPSVPLLHPLCEHCLYRLSVADWRRQL